MKLPHFAIFFLVFLTHPTKAAETEYTLEPIVVKANSSFDSLNDDQYLPQKKITFDSTRGGTLDTLDKKEPFPSVNNGYPSGAMGTSLGGRSMDDVQVSTIGVPLNLPQGGGPNLSVFPSFLWSGLSISTVPNAAGFSPQGVSGSMQFDLWTRTQVRELKFSTDVSRVTTNIDRNLQNFSVASKKDNIAILGGMNYGRQKGSSGSLSYYFIRKPKSHFIFHLLGTDQDGDSPGSTQYATPLARIQSWRAIPALESHQDFGDEEDPVVWESTAYADLQQLTYHDPAATSSSTRTQQYGIENALHWRDSTLALTGRLVNFQSSIFGSFSEWPILGQISHDFQLNHAWKMRWGAGGNFVTSVGFAPTARASFKYALTSTSAWFFELNSLAKMPTLAARYYVSAPYHGNPNLKVERVNALLAGFETTGDQVESTTTFKGEYRNQIQVNQNNTTENAGNASLFSVMEDFKWKASSLYTANSGMLITSSKMADSGYSYPDLPFFTVFFGSTLTFSDQFKLKHDIHYNGHSIAAGGASHADYMLMNASFDYTPLKGTTFTLGCENLEDKRAEVVINYPLPGRILYLNFISTF